MLAESLLRLEAEVVVLDPDPHAAAHQRLPGGIVAPLDDPAALAELARRVDVATYEFENVPVPPLATLDGQVPLWPSREVLRIAQDRTLEKALFAAHGFGPVGHVAVPAGTPLREAVRRFGLPAIVKTARGGYDGKGQSRVLDESALAALPEHAPTGGAVIEEVVDIVTEISVLVARGADGTEVTFPLFENLHRDHILDLTVVPARVPAALDEAARATALAISRTLDVVGLLTVEFFVGRGRGRGGQPVGELTLYVNELAPRPHNSGHVTRAATTPSQFDALARILVGAPLHAPTFNAPGAFCMANLLGDVWLRQGTDPGGPLVLDGLRAHPRVRDLVLYGKRPARPGRKMGHLVVWAPTADEALRDAAAARDALCQPVRRP
jgi:5-(carboxyamino)imidazole ribonucleotide synthase